MKENGKRLDKASWLAALALTIGLGTGCTSVWQDHYTAGMGAEMVDAKFKPTVETMPGAKAKGSAKSSVVFWFIPASWPNFFSSEANEETKGFFHFRDPLREAAVYEACNASGADILLAPRFTEERHTGFLWFFRKRTVSVEGIPARVTGAKEIPVEKWPLLFGANSGTQLIKNVP